MKNCVEVNNLRVDYGDFVLKDVSFSVPGGSIVGLIGENGAGKTTTLKSILGLIHPEGGEIKIFERPADAQSTGEIGVVLDDCYFHDTLRPKDVDVILAPMYEHWDSALFQSYLEKFHLPEKKYIKEFSRGMKVKLSLAAALSHRPKLLILDEATAGLDPVVRDEILDEFLGFLTDEDHAILISSHIITDLEKVADYIIYLKDGALVLSESKDDVLDHYGCLSCTRQQMETVDSEDFLRVRRGEFGCRALVRDRREIARKYPKFQVEPISLEELMIFFGRGEEQ